MSTFQILLVEDNPGDVRLTREAMREVSVDVQLLVAGDGVQAVEILQSAAASGELPDLVILDLNLPRRSGRETLEIIKSDPALLEIPVVVLSSSQADADIRSAYALHANCFVTKPTDLDDYISVVGSIVDFWFNVVRLPPREK